MNNRLHRWYWTRMKRKCFINSIILFEMNVKWNILDTFDLIINFQCMRNVWYRSRHDLTSIIFHRFGDIDFSKWRINAQPVDICDSIRIVRILKGDSDHWRGTGYLSSIVAMIDIRWFYLLFWKWPSILNFFSWKILESSLTLTDNLSKSR